MIEPPLFVTQKDKPKNSTKILRPFVFSLINALSDGGLNIALCVALQNKSFGEYWLAVELNQSATGSWVQHSEQIWAYIIWKSGQEDCLCVMFFTHFLYDK